MKLLHISDLHIGKRVNEFNMIEDQTYILNQIIELVQTHMPDAILIAGDVYDKSQPSTEAVVLLDYFLTKLTEFGQPIFLISGNHDSPERLNFGSQLLHKNKLHIAGVFDGSLPSIPLTDTYGTVLIHLLPFLKPAMLRPFYEEPIDSYHDAVSKVISSASIDTSQRNVLIAHQFVTNGSQEPERSDSEHISIGGLDQIDASAFADFDYVALGHLHGPQKVGRESIRYSGSPLKYSFSEARHNKSVVLIELKEKGDTNITLLPLTPLHDLRQIKGPIAALLQSGKEEVSGQLDYIHATLTDEDDIYDAIGQLREVYPNLMLLDFENNKNQQNVTSIALSNTGVESKSPLELFLDFYEMQNNEALSDEQLKMMHEILAEGEEDHQ